MNISTRMKTFSLTFLILAVSTFSVGCGSGGKANLKIPGVKGPILTLNNDNMLISMVFEKIELPAGLRYDIPKYPNSYIEISPDLESNGTLMSVSISLQDVFNGGINSLPPQTLPGGRPLPGVASGRLPAVAFSIEKFKNIAFYLGPKFFGIFVPVKKMGIGTNIISARFYTGKIRAGNLSAVGVDENGENSGLLLLLDLKSKAAKVLEKSLD